MSRRRRSRLSGNRVKRRIDQEVDDEIQGHIALRARDLEAQGHPPEEAWHLARRLFGRAEPVAEECRKIQGDLHRRRWWRMSVDELKADLIWGLRSLRRAPGFAVFATVTLALGIAANTAIVSVVNGIFFRAVPGVVNPETLVEISRGPGFVSVSHPVYAHFRDNAPPLQGLAAFDVVGLAIGAEDGPEVVMGLQVTGNYFDVLGTRPAAGRFFSAQESSVPPPAPLAVLTHALWTRRFEADPAVVGSTLRLNGQPVTIIGVAEEGFVGHAAAIESSIFILVGSPVPAVHQGALNQLESGVLELIGRVRPGTDHEALASRLSRLADAQLAEAGLGGGNSYVARVQGYAAVPGSIRGPASVFFAILSVLVGLLLIISCVNVANLLLARSATRRREIAVRMSLGAGRWRLVRQLLTESVLLALLAGGLGTLLAYWGTSILSAFQLPVAPIPGLRLDLHLAPDGAVLLYSLILTTVTGLLFGLAPALRATRNDLVTDLKGGSDDGSTGGGRLRATLVGAQVAATIILLTASGLFLRAVLAVETVDPAFAPADVHVASFDLELAGRTDQQSWEFYDQLLMEAAALPGVQRASVAGKLPLAGLSQMAPVNFEGVAPPEGRDGFTLANQSVGWDYFETLGITLLQGRGFGVEDRPDRPPVVVINERLADEFWPNSSPLGQHVMTPGLDGPVAWEVIGVVETAKYRRLNEDPRAFAYFPAAQRPRTDMTLHVKMSPGVPPPIRAIRAAAARLEPAAALLSVGSLDSAIGIFMLPQRIGAWVGGLMGLVGLLLGGIGVYGITAYWVSQRTREVGIRMALGANRFSVTAGVIRSGMRAPLVGAVIGLGIALVTSRFLESFLFGVSPLDPATLLGVVAVLGGTAALANLIPALRAARVDPARVLKAE